MRLTFYDKLFVALVVIISLSLFVFNLQLAAGPARRYVTVHVDNKLIMEISFDENTDKKVAFPFGAVGEHTAVLEISRGKVRLLPLDRQLCPRGICTHTGWISKGYQSIVCVPNRIVISFGDPNGHDQVDGVTF